MTRVTVANFVPVFRDPPQGVEIMEGMSAEEACRRIRETFASKKQDLMTWSELIRSHCRIPSGHPFRELLESQKVGEDDYLWTLGGLAFGTVSGWIEVLQIQWDDGSRATFRVPGAVVPRSSPPTGGSSGRGLAGLAEG